MTAVRQKLRETLIRLIWRIESQGRHGLSASGWDTLQRLIRSRRKQNGSVRAPGAAARLRRARHSVHDSAGQIDALQLAVGKECDGLLSGDQNGYVRFSVPASGWAVSESIGRSQS